MSVAAARRARPILWLVPLLGAVLPQAARAWGAQGHEMIARIAMQGLPAALPAFLRAPEAADEVERLSPVPDRLKGAGRAWDHDHDEGHFLDLGDDGKIAGAVPLAQLPPTREAYDTALRAAGSDQYKVGYLPYMIVDGWQQLAKDFAQWRAATAEADHAQAPADKAFFARDQSFWAGMAIHDLGVWSHFVGDGSQPLHVSIHYNGWGRYPNPQGFTTKPIHAFFETDYVRANLTADLVRQALPAPRDTGADIFVETSRYLADTQSRVVAVYTLDKQGAFVDGNREAIALEALSLAAGAAELRDLVAAAWAASAAAKVGYPPVPLADIVSGRATVSPREVTGAP
jgi:hypothetical protein